MKRLIKIGIQFFAEESADAAEQTKTQTDTSTTPVGQTDEGANTTGDNVVTPDINDLIQRAVDRATNKLGNDNKKLKEQLDKVHREKLSAEELKQLEIADREAQIAEKEALITEKENRLYALKSVKSAGIDCDDEIIDFVMGATESDIDTKVATFKKIVDNLVKVNVDKTFKDNGRVPEKSGVTGYKNTGDANIGTTLGKASLEQNKASREALEFYLGGKR